MSTPELLIFAIAGDQPPRRVPLARATLSIGREPGNDLVLPDSSVSRQPVVLSQSGDTWYIARQRGAGRLLVNGHALDKTSLQPGDQLVLGNTVLRFEVPGAQPRLSVPAPGAAPRPLPQLRVVCEGERFDVPLHEPALTLGRAPDCNIVVPSPLVSGHHARLTRGADGAYTIEDTRSTNGLTLNGARVTTHALRDGDTLAIGDGSGGAAVTLTFSWPVAVGVVARSSTAADAADGDTLLPGARPIRARGAQVTPGTAQGAAGPQAPLPPAGVPAAP